MLKLSVEAPRIHQVGGQLFVDEFLLGNRFHGLLELETQRAKFLFMLCMCGRQPSGDGVIGLLCLAQRGGQCVDLIVCVINTTHELAIDCLGLDTEIGL